MASYAGRPQPVAWLAAERRFFFWMTFAVTAIVAWGFAPSFYLRGLVPVTITSYLDAPPHPMRGFYIVHGLVFSAWMLLMLVQAGLVTAGNVALHRRLGVLALGLVPLMAVLGVMGGIYAGRNGFHDVPFAPASFMAVPLFSMAGFVPTIAIALAQRRNPATHKRLMLLGTMMIVGAATARIALVRNYVPPEIDPTLLLLLPLLAWDWITLRRLHPATLWGGLALIFVSAAPVPIGLSPAWLALVKPLVG